MRRERLKWIAVYAMSLIAGQAFTADRQMAFSDPSADDMIPFDRRTQKTFVLERYDADGHLAAREIEALRQSVEIRSATDRVIAGHTYRLRGLSACPRPTITYNHSERWSCADAASDYMGTIYNERASVILCKTLALESDTGTVDPVSCFALVGGGTGDPLKVVSDDDAMVFLGLAEIAKMADGQLRRPDLQRSDALSRLMGLGDAQ